MMLVVGGGADDSDGDVDICSYGSNDDNDGDVHKYVEENRTRSSEQFEGNCGKP
jgi:hypothetical protein